MPEANDGAPIFGLKFKNRPPGVHPLIWREQLREQMRALVTPEGAEQLANWPVTDGSKLGYGR